MKNKPRLFESSLRKNIYYKTFKGTGIFSKNNNKSK